MKRIIALVALLLVPHLAVALEFHPVVGIGTLNAGPPARSSGVGPPEPIAVMNPIPPETQPPDYGTLTFERALAPQTLMEPPPPLALSVVGITTTGYFPPDPVVAAGPSIVVAVVNGGVALFSKGGVILMQRDLTAFFNGSLANAFVYDPRVLYDPHSGRFIVVALDNETTENYLRIAVSKTSAPTNLSVGPGAGSDWYGYDINASRDGGVLVNPYWADFPGAGLDQYNLYLTTNMFDTSPGLPHYPKLWIIHKAQLLAGGPITPFEYGGPGAPLLNPFGGTDFTIKPATNYDQTAAYLMSSGGTFSGIGYLTVWTVNSPSGTPVLTNQTLQVAPFYGLTFGIGMPDCPQLGGGANVDTQDSALHTLVQRNGHLWTAQTAANAPVSPTRTEIHWYEIDPLTPAVVQSGTLADPVRCYFYPELHPDAAGNVTLVMSGVDASIYGSAFYTARFRNDPLGEMRSVALLKAGESHWEQLDGLNRNRWGDYGGISWDPMTGDAWMLHEYAAAFANTWGTWLGRVAAVHDTVVAALPPKKIVIPFAAMSVTKKIKVKVTNADVLPTAELPGHTVQLSGSPGDCTGVTLSTPDFDAKTPLEQDTALLKGGSSKVATVLVTVPSASFTSFNFKAPKRCTLSFTATTISPDASEPTVANNTATLELNIVDKNDPEMTTVHESVLASINPVAINIAKLATSATKDVKPQMTNADYKPSVEVAGHSITVTASDGDCPAGTVGLVDHDPSTPVVDPTITVKGGATKAGKLALTVNASAFQTYNRKSPTRCTAILSAAGPGIDPEPSNNTTQLVIDVFDKNDF